jgi:hypothetical protein
MLASGLSGRAIYGICGNKAKLVWYEKKQRQAFRYIRYVLVGLQKAVAVKQKLDEGNVRSQQKK